MDKRVTGIAIGLLGVAALCYGLFTDSWVVGSDFGIESHVGLRATEQCQTVTPEPGGASERACETVPHSAVVGTPGAIDGFGTFRVTALITFWTGIATAALLALVMGLAAARRFPDLPVSPSTLAIMAAFAQVVLTSVTLAVHPWKKIGWGTGTSMMIAGAGAAACLFAAIVLGRIRPPVRDEW